MFTTLAVLLITLPVHADDQSSYVNYESIVSELKMDAETPLAPKQEAMDWDAIAIHGSLGLAGAMVSVPNPRRAGNTLGLLKGFETAVGANTFSRHGRAELAFRNFASERLGTGLQAEMRELEARMIFLPQLEDQLRMRMGFGLTHRMLNVQTDEGSRDRSGVYYTLLLGAERQVGRAVSVGPDLAYRDSLNRGGGRKSSWDASFRLNATF